MEKTNTNPRNTIVIITIVIIVCKILGFLKNSVLANYYGTSPIVDAYAMTFSIGTITSGWIAGLIGNFTPKYKEIEAKKGHSDALLFSSSTYNLIVLLVFILIIFLEVLAPNIVRIVASGFDDITHNYTVHFFRLYCGSILFYASFRFSQEFLNCNQMHLAAMWPDVLISALSIIAIIASKHLGEDYLIYGYVFAVLLQGLIAHYYTQKAGFRVGKARPWNDDIKSLIIMAIPIFLSNTLSNINNLIDKIFASNLESGIVASLDYANTMKEFAYQIGTMALITMIFPILSKHWANNNFSEFKNRVICFRCIRDKKLNEIRRSVNIIRDPRINRVPIAFSPLRIEFFLRYNNPSPVLKI